MSKKKELGFIPFGEEKILVKGKEIKTNISFVPFQGIKMPKIKIDEHN